MTARKSNRSTGWTSPEEAGIRRGHGTAQASPTPGHGSSHSPKENK